MSTHKRIDIVCYAAAFLAVLLTVLLMNGRALGIVSAMGAEVGDGMFTAKDLDAGWDVSSATKIVLSDQGSKINGNGAYVYDGNVYIAYAGYYVLTGELTDGSVIIDAEKSDDIWLSLEGVALHCEDDAAIRVEQADKVILTLAEGTKNTVSSGEQYDEKNIASGVDGAIYSRDDLTINGVGALTVDAAYQHGIVCNDDLVIAGGDITIKAAEDGIHANDSVRVQDAAISISAGDDGITVSNDEETAFIYVASGNISISECYEGLEAIDITIAGGTIDIAPTDDGINANGYGGNSAIRITGGDITIINPSGRDADGLDSNGSIYIEGGRTFVSVSGTGGNCALDCGSENGGECVVNGGIVIACGGSTMAEGFDAGSTQGFLMYNANAEAGTTIRLADSQGRELLSEEIPCSFSSAVISTPELKIGDICTIDIGGEQEQVTIDNSSASGFMAAGAFRGGMHNGMKQDRAKQDGAEQDNAGQDDIAKQNTEKQNGVEQNDAGQNDAKQSVEKQNGVERDNEKQNNVKQHGEKPDGAWQDGMEPPERPDGEWRADLPDGGNKPDRQMGGQRMHGNSENPIADNTQPGIILILLGVSVAALLGGLFLAMKIKY